MGNERTELALAEERESASAPMEMIHKAFEAAIANGSGLEVVDRILSHQREMMDYQDRERFQAALRRIQDELKPIVKDAENPETHSKYASAEAVDNAIQGLLERERMTLSFEPESHPSPEMVRIVGVLSLGAYSKRYPLDMPADGKGAKGGGVMSRTHATGSAITYGKRYLKNMIFDLRLREKKMGLDDDGNKAAGLHSQVMPDTEFIKHRERLENAPTKSDLNKFYIDAIKAAHGDDNAVKQFEKAATVRIREL